MKSNNRNELSVRKDIRKALAKEHSCYVLITCSEASKDGEMAVEMSYDGDPILASYLLQSAHHFVEEEGIEQLDEMQKPQIKKACK